MNYEQQQEILQDREVSDVHQRAIEAGIPRSVIDKAIDKALSGINPGYRVAVKMIVSVLLQLLKEHENKRERKTFFGRLLKAIFG